MRHRESRDMRHQFLALAGPRPVLAARRRRIAFADLHQHRPVGQAARRAGTLRDRIDHDLGVQAAGDDHRSAGQKHRPVARAAPQHQPVPARRPFRGEQRFANPRMNPVGADQDIAAHGLGVRTGAVEEVSGDAALVLGEGPEPAAGVNGVMAETLLDGAMDHALQPSAMNRELRNVVAGIDAARFLPDFLSMAIEIIKLAGADRDVIELLQQAKPGEFADRMRQGVDADAEFADGIRLLEQLAADAPCPQHQRGGQAADTAADDNCLHRPTPLNLKRDAKALNLACGVTRPQAASSPPPSARPGSSA